MIKVKNHFIHCENNITQNILILILPYVINIIFDSFDFTW
jgi:hypothetical protein